MRPLGILCILFGVMAMLAGIDAQPVQGQTAFVVTEKGECICPPEACEQGECDPACPADCNTTAAVCGPGGCSQPATTFRRSSSCAGGACATQYSGPVRRVVQAQPVRRVFGRVFGGRLFGRCCR